MVDNKVYLDTGLYPLIQHPADSNVHYTVHIYHKVISDTGESSYDCIDISDISHSIEYTTTLSGQAGKLALVVEKDNNNVLVLSLGDMIAFWNCSNPVFLGYIFTIETNDSESYTVTAYDQMRYLQQGEFFTLTEEMKLEDVFEYMCCKLYQLKYKVGDWKEYRKNCFLNHHLFMDESAYDILQYCINETMYMSDADDLTERLHKKSSILTDDEHLEKYHTWNSRPYYFLRDDFGTLTLHDIVHDTFFDDNGKDKEIAIIGDDSLLTSYDYSVSIDGETYNSFIFTVEETIALSNEEQDVIDSEESEDDSDFDIDDYLTEDTTKKKLQRVVSAVQAGKTISGTGTWLDGEVLGVDTIKRWGTLRKIIDLKGITDTSYIYAYCGSLFEIYNQPTRKLRITALGYDGVYAGSPIWLKIDKLGLDVLSYVVSVTHKYDSDVHTMDLEVMIKQDIKKTEDIEYQNTIQTYTHIDSIPTLGEIIYG